MVDKIRVSVGQPRDFPSLGASNGPKGGSRDRVGADIAPGIKGEGDVGDPSEQKVPGRSPRGREYKRLAEELVGRCKGGWDPPDKVESSSNFRSGLGGYDGIPQEAIGRPSVGEGKTGRETHDNLYLIYCEESVCA